MQEKPAPETLPKADEPKKTKAAAQSAEEAAKSESRKKGDSAQTASEKRATKSGQTPSKGRPTPSRKEAEAARHRPLVPKDRKAAKEQARAKARAQRADAYQKERMALETGDERYLPARDKGRVRRYVRNRVDSRWTVSEFLLPVMLIFLAGMLAVSFVSLDPRVGQALVIALTALFYGLLAASLVESFVLWRTIKKEVAQKYPKDEIPKRTGFYTYSRMVMARRWRAPKPQVVRGQTDW